MLHTRLFWTIWFFCLGLLCPAFAHAYLDPGTGSMLLSALIGIVATCFFMAKAGFYKLQSLVQQGSGTRSAPLPRNQIVFYSEGAQYWRTFKPIVETLLLRNVPITYLSSGENDPGLALEHPYLTSRHLRPGNWTFATMNMLEADICVMTTPGLDVLQIRRSKGVRHYAHIVHAVTDAAFYKLYSFDYYDSVLCSGSHQICSIRYLESLRGTAPKLLLETGCPYIDALAEELEAIESPATKSGALPRLLIAPTWGTNGLLSRFGVDLLLPLAQKGYPITVRPHPQTFISEAQLFERIAEAMAPYSNVQFDRNPSGLAAMVASDVLISDLSGIVFDYAFLLERPVITIAFTPSLLGQEANDLPWEAWELSVLPDLGAHIAPDAVQDISSVIAALPGQETFVPRIRNLRDQSLFHFRTSGEVAAAQLLAIHESLDAPSGGTAPYAAARTKQ